MIFSLSFHFLNNLYLSQCCLSGTLESFYCQFNLRLQDETCTVHKTFFGLLRLQPPESLKTVRTQLSMKVGAIFTWAVPIFITAYRVYNVSHSFSHIPVNSPIRVQCTQTEQGAPLFEKERSRALQRYMTPQMLLYIGISYTVGKLLISTLRV